MKQIDAAIEALDALVCSADLAGDRHGFDNRWHKLSDKGAAAIAGLRSLKEQEPVAWMHRSNSMHFIKERPLGEIGFLFVPLYANPAPEAKQEPFINWESLRDPVTLHVNLLRGIPAKLTEAQLRHLIGEQAQPAPEQTKQFIENFDELKAKQEPEESEGCWKCGEDGGTSCGAVHCGLLETEEEIKEAACPHCGSDSNERDELCKAEREVDRLTAQNAQLLGALKKIATVNAMDYEYQAWASAAIAQVEGEV